LFVHFHTFMLLFYPNSAAIQVKATLSKEKSVSVCVVRVLLYRSLPEAILRVKLRAAAGVKAVWPGRYGAAKNMAAVWG
jgi:hypothetical protein